MPSYIQGSHLAYIVVYRLQPCTTRQQLDSFAPHPTQFSGAVVIYDGRTFPTHKIEKGLKMQIKKSERR